MTTNKEWLFSLPLEEQIAWMESEHQEPNPDCSAMLYKMFTENMKQEPCSHYEPKDDVDSRERLEADVRDTVTERHVDTIIGWLDRQAAITAEETSDAWEEYRDVTQREIAELQEQVYELQAALDLISISLALPMTSKPITPDMRKPEVLAKLIIETIKKLANEREHYRSKFSRALGYADDIHALMDDEGMA